MSVSEQDVRHIASLARLGLDAERVPTIVGELNRILEHMDVLQQVDVSDAGELPVPAGMPLRDDEPGRSVPLERERADFAPSYRDGFFLVPRLATHGALGASADAAGLEDGE